MDKKKAIEWIRKNKEEIDQTFRLNYHFMGEIGWINDPNGFCSYKGEYHLFYQFYPYDSKWGPMHWGHATSKDFITWKHQEVALAPDSPQDENGCFSGTAIEIEEILYLFYTGHIASEGGNSQVQNMARSKDGVYFEKYTKNPIIGKNQIPVGASIEDFRDPKILMEDGKYYILVGSKDKEGIGQILCYSSTNLIKWHYGNVFLRGSMEFGEMWECPDLLRFEEEDILIISPQYMPRQEERFQNLHSSIYIVGKANLKDGIFKAKNYYEIDCGFDFYAPQTLKTKEGKIILIAWMDMWETPKPTDSLKHKWAGAMTIPREITYKKGRIFVNPVESIENYRYNEIKYQDVRINGSLRLPSIEGNCYELQLVLDLTNSKDLICSCFVRKSREEHTEISYNQKCNSLKLNRDFSGIGLSGTREIRFDKVLKELELRIFVDQSSIEIFINKGSYTMTSRIFPSEDSIGIKFYTNQEYRIKEIRKWEIKNKE